MSEEEGIIEEVEEKQLSSKQLQRFHHAYSVNLREDGVLEKIAQDETDLKHLMQLKKIIENSEEFSPTLTEAEEQAEEATKGEVVETDAPTEEEKVTETEPAEKAGKVEAVEETAENKGEEKEEDSPEMKAEEEKPVVKPAVDQKPEIVKSASKKADDDLETSSLRNQVRQRFASSKNIFENKSKSSSMSGSQSFKKSKNKNNRRSERIRSSIAAKVRAGNQKSSYEIPKPHGTVGLNQSKLTRNNASTPSIHSSVIRRQKKKKKKVTEEERTLSAMVQLKQRTSSKGPRTGGEVSKPVLKPVVRHKKEEWDDLDAALKEAFWEVYESSNGTYHQGYAVKGWRHSMEDVMDVFFSYDPKIPNLFAVYDGHGGDSCANFCKNYLLKRLAVHSELKKNPKAALADTFITVDDNYNSSKKDPMAGTTATVIYICPMDIRRKSTTSGDSSADMALAFKFYCACVGDSRAVLVYQTGKVVALSLDHNLKRKDELERIRSGNGEVRYDSQFNELLVYSEEAERGLNVTRTIGDVDFKPLVTAFPDVKEGFLTKDAAYLIVASDGLWGHVTNEEAGRILLDYGTKTGSKNLANLANCRGCYDNCTIVAIDVQKMLVDMEDLLR